ncbi:hypothetical protein BH11PSE3_BH11PSE3_49760 [soil metagenome]
MSTAGADGTSVLAVLVRSLALVGAAAAGSVLQRAASMVLAYLLVAGLFGISLGFLTFSGYRALAGAMGSIHASLVVGCVYLFGGLVVMVIVQSRRR